MFSSIAKSALLLLGVSNLALAAHGNHSQASCGSEPLPMYLDHHGIGVPWGNRTVKDHPYEAVPETGVTVKFDFTIARGVMSPDGYHKNALLINGQFPGPRLEANWGDWLEVTVHNRITGPEEGTAMHFHGFTQIGTPWMDGVPSISACPIAPGESYTYRFRADSYGTSWYHAHFLTQSVGGVVGPAAIYGPSSAPYDIDLGHVVLTEYYHKEHLQLDEDLRSTNETLWRPLADNNLINGLARRNCTLPTGERESNCIDDSGVPVFKFTSGKAHRMRLINSGAAALQHFMIDGHNMTVIANDMVAVEPYSTNVITLASGQRTDIIVDGLIGDPAGAYWIRSNVSDFCAFDFQPEARAIIYYEEADTTALPCSEAWPRTPQHEHCGNDDLALTTPSYPISVDPNPEVVIELEFDRQINSQGQLVWTNNGVGFHGDNSNPILPLVNKNATTYYNPEWSTKIMNHTGSVRIVMHDRSESADHPMHLHGHDFHVIGEGRGRWDGVTLNSLENPQRRDTQQIRRGGYLVIQFVLDNPGVWAFHCHIAWHLETGFSMTFIERPDDIIAFDVPESVDQGCKSWKAYQNRIA